MLLSQFHLHEDSSLHFLHSGSASEDECLWSVFLYASIYCGFVSETIFLESGSHGRQLHVSVSGSIDVASQLLSCTIVDEKLEIISISVPLYAISHFPPAHRLFSHWILLVLGFQLFVCLRSF